MVAPFFVFQVICLILWSLDEYWYYSAMTLVMLMVFEGMLCNQRLNSLAMLRAMRRAPIKIFVYRNNIWEYISSDQIIPGDIISITTNPISSTTNESKLGNIILIKLLIFIY